MEWHTLEVQEVAKKLKTNIKRGLLEEEIKERQKQFGKNILPKKKPLPKIKIFIRQFKSPLIYILLIAGIITSFLKEWTDTIVILTAVFINSVVGYIQEFKASRALIKLGEVIHPKAVVLRDGEQKEVLRENLVPGDIVFLKAGNHVPADGRIIQSFNLKINEASLSGEWLLAEKHKEKLPKDTPLADRDNMAYLGTTIEQGEGMMIVTAIGHKTEMGKIANLIKNLRQGKTPYQRKISNFSKILSSLIALICIFIFIGGIAEGRDFVQMFTTAVAVAVAAVPEGLPVAITVVLTVGMQRILKKKGLVRRLASAETLGNTTIIATDKTLTLTEGKMKVVEILSLDKNLALKISVLCNEGFIEKGFVWKVKGRPTDKALIMAGEENGIRKVELEKQFPRIGEIPFNSQTKMIVTFHKTPKKGENILFVSGAPEKVIALSSYMLGKGKEVRIDKKKLLNDLERMAKKGERVIAVGYKKINKDNLDKIEDIVFVGLIGLKDPLRKEAKRAIKLCQKAGLKPIIVTGDHIFTARAVAEELGLKTKRENLMQGREIDNLSDKELIEKLDKVTVFARVEPVHKLRIIEAWQEKGQVVAMTGDGLNDSLALKKADIGVALGSGTDVAKEVSDLILLDDNFSIILTAIEEGRGILDNIRKVITYSFSDAFTEIILIGLSIMAKLPLPITAVQILWVNLIEDSLPNIALSFEPKEKDLMSRKPKGHKVSLLNKEMKIIIFAIGILTDLFLFGIFLAFYKELGISNIKHIRTLIFTALSIDSLFYIFSCKSLRKNIWQINLFSNKLLILSWIIGFIAILSAIYVPVFQKLLDTVPLSLFDWIVLISLGLIEIISIETVKHYFIVHKLN